MTSRGQAKPKAKRLCLRLTGLGALNTEGWVVLRLRPGVFTEFIRGQKKLRRGEEGREKHEPIGPNRQFGADCWQNVDTFGSLT